LIHPTAVVSGDVRLGSEVEIGPYAVVGDEVTLGPGTKVGPHAVIERWTKVGEGCTIGSSAVIGTAPQDVGYQGHRSYVRIGDRTVIREYVTINRSKEPEGVTIIGNDCYLMTSSHVAHDCCLGDEVVIVNLATLGGHVLIGNGAFVSSMVVIHQFVRIGELSLVSAQAAVRKDVPPYTILDHHPRFRGLNVVGLRRKGVPPKSRSAIKHSMKILLDDGLQTGEAVKQIRKEYSDVPEVGHLADFVEKSERGIYR
jgi:UDP-N-acetylglucosamine acyltransferase